MRTAFAIIASSVMVAATIATATIAGTWTGSYNTPGGPRPLNLVFVVDGTKLTGTVKRETGDLPLVGQVKGDSVTFSYTITYNEHPLDMTYVGKVTGDLMKGTVDFGGGGQDTFEAKRASGKSSQ